MKLRYVLLVAIYLAGISFAGHGAVSPWLSGRAAVQVRGNTELVTLSVTDETAPLARMTELLEPKIGIPICYEDPDWSESEDFMPYRENPATANDPRLSRLPGGTLRRGSLEMAFFVKLDRRPVDPPEKLLGDIIDEHSKRRNPGEFTVVKLPYEGFSVVPVSVRDKSGRLIEQHSPFDVRISFPEAQRDLGETIGIILKAVSAESGKHVSDAGQGWLGLNGGAYSVLTLKLGANGEIARDVLAKAFNEARYKPPVPITGVPKMSWHLSYATGLKGYVFNLRGVAIEMSTPRGGRVLEPSDRPNLPASPFPK
jgi:hypothetical protein